MRPEEVAQFRRRILADCMLEGMVMYWERRAKDFDHVVAGDCTPGTDGPAAAAAITERAKATAQACRNKAAVLRLGVASE